MPAHESFSCTKFLLMYVTTVLVFDSLAEANNYNLTDCVNLAGAGNTEICGQCAIPKPTAPAATPKPAVDPRSYRLPKSLIPHFYNLEIQTIFNGNATENFTFKGSVSISFLCRTATNNVTLHSKGLEVDTSEIRLTTGGPNYINASFDTIRDFLIIEFDRSFEEGKNYTIELKFSGKIVKGGKGLFYGHYETPNKTKIYAVCTQLQATEARRVFPCFDEPGLRAEFQITVVRPSHLKSVSNMNIIRDSETIEDSGVTYVKDVYEVTPRMSTYLVAFAVFDFPFVQGVSASGYTVRMYSTPQHLNFSQFYLEKTIQALDFFEKYFGVPYSLRKLDNIIMPGFLYVGMENWGMITYNEKHVVVDLETSSTGAIEVSVQYVGHEVAHQWFGDLVTPSWWDDLWLNEGFAKYMEYLAADHLYPDWDMLVTFVPEVHQDAMKQDGRTTSHPVYEHNDNAEAIIAKFDQITYKKGAALLRMLDFVLGKETFLRALNAYIKEHSLSVVSHKDLIRATERQAKLDNGLRIPVDFMKSWLYQMNYPMVTVKPSETSIKSVDVSQTRFLESKTVNDTVVNFYGLNYKWIIPLTFTTSLAPNFNPDNMTIYWLQKEEDSIRLKGKDAICSCGWYIANVHQIGYYRVNYPVSNWVYLAEQMKKDHKVIGTINRGQLIDDAFNIAKAGHIELDIPFKVIEYLEKEQEFAPWYAAISELYVILGSLTHTELEIPFKNFLKTKVRPVFLSIGLNSTKSSYLERKMRKLIGSFAYTIGLEEAVDQAKQQFELWIKNQTTFVIDVNIKGTVLCAGIAHGGRSAWSNVTKMIANNHKEKEALENALSCSNNFEQLSSILNEIVEENSTVPDGDITYILGRMINANPLSHSLTWLFFRANYATLLQRDSLITHTIPEITASLKTKQELEELEQFIKLNKGNLGVGETSLIKAVEDVKGRVAWMNENFPKFKKYLERKGFIKS